MRLLKKLAWALIVIIVIVVVLVGSQVKFDMPVENLKALYTNDASQFLVINDLEIHFRDEGSGEPLLLLHGTASSLHTWDGWTAALQDSFRVIRLDLPAFGLTGPDPKDNYSMANYVDLLERFVEKIGLDSFNIAGNSFGGRIAIEYLLKNPETVKKLILVDASWYKTDKDPPPALAFKMAQNKISSKLVRWATRKSLVKSSLHEVYGDETKINDTIINRYYDMLLRKGNRAAFIARVNTDYGFNNPAIRSIKQPTLILWGDQDKWIPAHHAALFEKDIMGSKLVIYKGVGHIPMEEIPDETAADVMKFLLAG